MATLFSSWLFWLVVLVVLFLLWLYFSKSQTASALRAKIPGMDKKAASAVDSVQSRMEAAQAAQSATLAKGRRSLYAIQQDIAASNIAMNHTKAEIEQDYEAMEAARLAGDKDTFATLAEEWSRDKADLEAQITAHRELVTELQSLEGDVDEVRAELSSIESATRVMTSKARVADVKTDVKEARAGLTTDGAQSQIGAAQKILDQKLAKAEAATAAAEGLTPEERAQRKAATYIKQVQRGGGVNVDELWNKMGPPETPATPAS